MGQVILLLFVVYIVHLKFHPLVNLCVVRGLKMFAESWVQRIPDHLGPVLDHPFSVFVFKVNYYMCVCLGERIHLGKVLTSH